VGTEVVSVPATGTVTGVISGVVSGVLVASAPPKEFRRQEGDVLIPTSPQTP